MWLIDVHDEVKSVVVKYPKPKGGTFFVKFVKNPNPVGFLSAIKNAKVDVD